MSDVTSTAHNETTVEQRGPLTRLRGSISSPAPCTSSSSECCAPVVAPNAGAIVGLAPSLSGTNEAGAVQQVTAGLVDDANYDAAGRLRADARRWGKWNANTVAAFNEAVKLHGRDFDGITRYIAHKAGKRRGGVVRKDYHQVRNFYYNQAKSVATVAHLTDKDIKVTREVRDLFVMVNFAEWRRKTAQLKLLPSDSVKFKELVLMGSTVLKTKGRRAVKITTPLCPALRKYCTEKADSPVSGISDSIDIELVPKTYADKTFVLRCEQNPFLRVKLNPDDRLSVLFECIKNRWRPVDAKWRDEADMQLKTDIVLHPGAPLIGASIHRSAEKTNTTAPPVYSLSRYIELRSGATATDYSTLFGNQTTYDSATEECAAVTQSHSQSDCSNDAIPTTSSATVPESAGAEFGSTDTENASRIQVADSDNPVRIDPSLLKNGIDESLGADVSAAQLAIMYPSSSSLRLYYAIDCPLKSEAIPAWQCLMTMIRRNFADHLFKRDQNTAECAPQQRCSTWQVASGSDGSQATVVQTGTSSTPIPIPGPQVANSASTEPVCSTIEMPPYTSNTRVPSRSASGRRTNTTAMGKSTRVFYRVWDCPQDDQRFPLATAGHNWPLQQWDTD